MCAHFNIFGQSVPAYALCILIGYGVGFIVVLLRAKSLKTPKENALIMYIFAGVGSFVGGKLFYICQYFPRFLELHEESGYTFAQYFSDAGLVFYGGMFGCVLFILLFCVILKYKFWDYTKLLIPSLPLVQAFGRIGCLMAGCCYGIPFEGGVYFPDSPTAAHDVAYLPIQPIESVCCVGLFIFMLLRAKKPRRDSDALGVYFLGYGTIRFILEFFRGDEIRGHLLALSTSQWVSIIVIALGVFFLFFYRKKDSIRPLKLKTVI